MSRIEGIVCCIIIVDIPFSLLVLIGIEIEGENKWLTIIQNASREK